MSIEDDVVLLERVPTLRLLGMTALRMLAIGSEQHNRTTIAFKFYPKGFVPKYQVKSTPIRNIPNDELEIPPNTVVRIREPREPARDLGLAHTRRADHEDVLRRDLGAQRVGHLRAAPAVAQRDRHRALRIRLADDVLVQLVDDLLRRHHRREILRARDRCGFRHQRLSTTWFWLV